MGPGVGRAGEQRMNSTALVRPTCKRHYTSEHRFPTRSANQVTRSVSICIRPPVRSADLLAVELFASLACSLVRLFVCGSLSHESVTGSFGISLSLAFLRFDGTARLGGRTRVLSVRVERPSMRSQAEPAGRPSSPSERQPAMPCLRCVSTQKPGTAQSRASRLASTLGDRAADQSGCFSNHRDRQSV